MPEVMRQWDEDEDGDNEQKNLVSLSAGPLPGQGCPGQDDKGAGQHLVEIVTNW